MVEVSIHNGQILVDGIVDTAHGNMTPPAAPKPQVPSELDPNEIARMMAAAISAAQTANPQITPMELVNVLLQLKDETKPTGQQKLVFTRWDLYQCFALWSKKLQGEQRL